MTYPFEVWLGAAQPLPNKSRYVLLLFIRQHKGNHVHHLPNELNQRYCCLLAAPLFSLGAICGLHQRENLIVENQPWKMSHEDQPEAKKWLAFCQSLFKQHQLSCLDRKDPAFVRQRRGRDEPFLKINFHRLEYIYLLPVPLYSAFKSKARFEFMSKIKGIWEIFHLLKK